MSPENPIQTKWCVVTGAPCSGKTSVLEEISKSGYRFIPETSRIYIEREKEKGLSLEDIVSDEVAFELVLTPLKVKVEDALPPDELIFLDRAMPDSITYYRLLGLDINEILPACKKYRYQHIFIFDPLPFKADGVRFEDEETRDFLDKQVEIDYQELGYQTTRVPVLSIKERAQYILKNLNLI